MAESFDDLADASMTDEQRRRAKEIADAAIKDATSGDRHYRFVHSTEDIPWNVVDDSIAAGPDGGFSCEEDRMRHAAGLSNRELRIAIVTSGDGGWKNIQQNDDGSLTGTMPGLTCGAVAVPDWPGDIIEAMKLEECMRIRGLLPGYVRSLARIAAADTSTDEGLYRMAHASARQRCEACLLTLQGATGSKILEFVHSTEDIPWEKLFDAVMDGPIRRPHEPEHESP